MTTSDEAAEPVRELPRVVYLVLSHKNPEQIRRLVDRILRGSQRARVLLQHDHSHTPLPPDAFSEHPRVTLMRPMRVEWGDWSQVEAVLGTMRWALDHLEFDWLCFISGQDYPLQPLRCTERELGRAEVDAFMEPPEVVHTFDGDWLSPDGDSVRRYLYRYEKAPAVLGRRTPRPLRHVAAQAMERVKRRSSRVLSYPMPHGAPPRVGLRRWHTPFTAQAPCRKGSEAGSYSRRCVEAIDAFLQLNPGAAAYFRRTISPSEAFLPTVVWNSPSLRIHPHNRRYIRWQHPSRQVPSSHPEVFRAEDLPDLLQSRAHFGRKFDAQVDDRVLDLLDDALSLTSAPEGLPGPPACEATAPALRPASESDPRLP